MFTRISNRHSAHAAPLFVFQSLPVPAALIPTAVTPALGANSPAARDIPITTVYNIRGRVNTKYLSHIETKRNTNQVTWRRK